MAPEHAVSRTLPQRLRDTGAYPGKTRQLMAALPRLAACWLISRQHGQPRRCIATLSATVGALS